MIETTEDYDIELQKLCREKFVLSTYTDQTAEDWLAMAEKFKAIDARANFAYCMNQARHYGYVEQPAPVEIPEPEYPQLPDEIFDWQTWSGDD